MRRWRLVALVVGAVLLATAMTPGVLDAVHAARWRVAAQDRPYTERALWAGAEGFKLAPERYRRLVSPQVLRRGGRVCVLLDSRFDHGGGAYQACYQAATGEAVSERWIGQPFGRTSLHDRALEFVLGI